MYPSLALFIAGLVIFCLVRYVASNSGSKHREDNANSIEDRWCEYSDYEVWEVAQRMLKNLAQESPTETSRQEENGPLESSQAEEGKASPENIPNDKAGPLLGFTLERSVADILLKNRAYFVLYPCVYCFDENYIICRVREGPRYHHVTSINPNPPQLETIFYIEGVAYYFDGTGVLWYQMGGFWLLETMHYDLQSALSELVKCIETNELHKSPEPIYSPLISDPGQSTSGASGSQDTIMDNHEGLRALPLNPDREDIDNWIEDMKRYRTMQVKEGIRVAAIHCPVPTCGKGQRRPQALRDHLYFHFNIKPHGCDFGCPIAFETEANKNRHLETCPRAPLDYGI
ncbi:unnamed protein product [Rhizoctonia solani]|uniref:C2H2-type domain-containing protein n=1 Tax=Rhizoctonia solani TaxID=456999 RepID=A0A8H3HHG3_9AGAM|nr:unnamed protein product [Rhizoctonia solani]